MSNEPESHEILRQIPHETIRTRHDVLEVYRLARDEDDGRNYELVELHAGREYRPHRHMNADAYFHFIVGEGTFITCPHDDFDIHNSDVLEYKPGVEEEACRGIWHAFLPKTQTLMLVVESQPIKDPSSGEIDIEYWEGEWKE